MKTQPSSPQQVCKVASDSGRVTTAAIVDVEILCEAIVPRFAYVSNVCVENETGLLRSLVNESDVWRAQAGRLRPQDRAHFIRDAARAMRSVVVDFARRLGGRDALLRRHVGGADRRSARRQRANGAPGLGKGAAAAGASS